MPQVPPVEINRALSPEAMAPQTLHPPHQQRLSAALAAPDDQVCRSFFEDYDDPEDVESGLSKVKRCWARCSSAMLRLFSGVHGGEATSRKKAEGGGSSDGRWSCFRRKGK